MPRGLARWENQMNTRKRFGSEVEFLDAEQWIIWAKAKSTGQ
jgi:hypothetical protein